MSRLSRRGMMSSVAALVPAVAVAGTTPHDGECSTPNPDADAELLALCQEFHRLNHVAHVMPDQGSAAWEQVRGERQDMLDTLHPMRPATVAGRVAKAGVAVMVMEDSRDRWTVTGTDAFVLDTLRAVAGMPQLVRGDVDDPDADFLAHLAAFEAVQAEIDALANRYSENDEEVWELPEMGVLWDRQREATDAMVAARVTTWPARQRLAEVLRAMGHREKADVPGIADECRLESLLLRSMFGGIGGAA